MSCTISVHQERIRIPESHVWYAHERILYWMEGELRFPQTSIIPGIDPIITFGYWPEFRPCYPCWVVFSGAVSGVRGRIRHGTSIISVTHYSARELIEVAPCIQSPRIYCIYRIICNVSINVTTSLDSKWVFRDEPSEGWAVISSTIVVKSVPIVFTPGVLEHVRASRAIAGRVPKGVVPILGGDVAGRIRKRPHAPECIRDRRQRSARVGATE